MAAAHLAITSREYLCPGEQHPIPRSVHLARQASGYARCRECPLCDDGKAQAGDRPGSPRPPASACRRLFKTEGVRGVYRNELDVPTAGRLAAAFAQVLWEDSTGPAPAAGFPVVVAYDDRPWSMPLAVAAAETLRRSGCETIEIGFATGPEFRFAVAHLDAVGGVYGTGSGGGPAVGGFDFALTAGRPLSLGGTLDRIATIAEHPVGRMTRRGAGRREFDASLPYEAGLRRHFRTFAPVTGVIGTASRLVLARLERLAADLPAKLHSVPLPCRLLTEDGTDSPGLDRLSTIVRERNADFGLWIDHDGTACRAIDEQGRTVPVSDLAAILLSESLAERPGQSVALDWPLAERLCGKAIRGEAVRGNGTAEAMSVSLRDHSPVAGADSAGRFWLPGPPPASDAIVTLARLLRALGTGGPLSRRLAAT